MAALATSDDVVAVLGRALTVDESVRVDAELDKASAFIRAETRRPFDPAEATVSRKVRDNGTVLLVDADTVSAVVAIDCDGSESAVSGWVQRGSKVYGLSPRTTVEVTHTRESDIPEALVGLAAQLAATALTSTIKHGVKSTAAGPYSETYAEGADGYLLSVDQASVLRAHSRLSVGSVTFL